MTLSKPEFAACTIIARNYLPMARALAESWTAAHPGSPFYVLLLDSPQGFFHPELEPFQTILLDKLEIPNLEGFLFKYTVLRPAPRSSPTFLNPVFRRIDR